MTMLQGARFACLLRLRQLFIQAQPRQGNPLFGHHNAFAFLAGLPAGLDILEGRQLWRRCHISAP